MDALQAAYADGFVSLAEAKNLRQYKDQLKPDGTGHTVKRWLGLPLTASAVGCE
jgi:hypothetical protein